ncbi:MAG: tyrosine-type recombinase/integrase [bacterium]
MPSFKREKTKYPGVSYIVGTSVNGKPERIYYIRYRRDGELKEEKAGRQFQNDMTPARAAKKRAARIDGKELSNKDQREAIIRQKQKEADTWSINRLWEAYKEAKPGVKGLVIDKYRYQKHIAPIFGSKEPKELHPFIVNKLRNTLLKTLEPGTVKKVLELLRRIINWGVRNNLCEGINFTIEMPIVNNLKTEDLTPCQLSRLLEAIDDDTNIQAGNLMKMALYTGMRRGELFKLKWDNIDFERGFISIQDPKGGPDQKIPLNDAARELLHNHPRIESDYVFPGKGGKKRVCIKKQVNRIKKRAGLPKDFRPLHGLRHVYASMLASSGKVDMYTLQKLLTHKSPLMTQRYSHLRDESLKRASTVASDLIKQASQDNKENVIYIEKKK